MWTSQFRMNFRILKEVFTMFHGDKKVTLEEPLKMELSEVSASIACSDSSVGASFIVLC